MSQALFTQDDSTNQKNDSINASIVNNYNKKLTLIEAQRKDDSIKRLQLQVELSSLKTTANLRKENLQQKI